jgi:hypothetical protein
MAGVDTSRLIILSFPLAGIKLFYESESVFFAFSLFSIGEFLAIPGFQGGGGVTALL